ncbi:sirohydrochlorin chelatase [Segeticoccus rhizosphaerae]|jgi:sirohydrochlorin ferrochelatase|uniref:sirohydrochlorin chelatase n=2 Tax=Segeticoccus rhizosphaerae TaxID=1104777 RepID=UPI0010C142E9|nr:CbiX/SirB N-terminal domain-containing protein [Ornithinicoccus soli]
MNTIARHSRHGPAARELLLVAHGTRDAQGQEVLERVRQRVGHRLPGVAVRLSYIDVIRPHLSDALAKTPECVVVPIFLSAGHHVRVDVPRAVAATGGLATVTPCLGPADAVLQAVADRLAAAGPVPRATVLAAAGSTDPRARDEVHHAADRLRRLLGTPVAVGFAASAAPTVADAVTALRGRGAATVGVASYLLAPGVFQARLDGSGADLIGEPIGAHPLLVDLVVRRFRSAAPPALTRRPAHAGDRAAYLAGVR